MCRNTRHINETKIPKRKLRETYIAELLYNRILWPLELWSYWKKVNTKLENDQELIQLNFTSCPSLERNRDTKWRHHFSHIMRKLFMPYTITNFVVRCRDLWFAGFARRTLQALRHRPSHDSFHKSIISFIKMNGCIIFVRDVCCL